MNFISKKLETNLIKIGIKKNDTVYLGINLGMSFKNYKNEIFQSHSLNNVRELCSELLFQAITKRVGTGGTVICPTFSFNFIKNKTFNVQKSKSDLGYFENFFLNQNKIVRSPHPVYSIAVWGKNKNIINPCGNFSFGENSPFSNFINYKVKFLNIGIKWIETCTYLHHLEHLNGFNHRFYKPTKGKITNRGKSITGIFYNPVRFMKLKSNKAEYKIKNYLNKNSILKETRDKIYCSSIKVKDIHDIGLKILKKKPSYFMSKDVNVFIDNKDRLTILES